MTYPQVFSRIGRSTVEVKQPVELSFVIPVYNGSRTIGRAVERIHELYADLPIEVVLVNDGSTDSSEQICASLVEQHPETVVFVQLARNFGEHNAELAGLNQTTGAFAAVLDDDGQNPPEEVRRMYDEIRSGNLDVVFGRYRVKRHGRLRNLGSWFSDRIANIMLKKPAELYLSSFKIMSRFIVDEITRYRGPFPYIGGLILRTSRNVGQVEVEHGASSRTVSNYTFRKLLLLWMNMFMNFSILPLRLAGLLGLATSTASLFLLAAVVIDRLYVNPGVPVGLPTLLVTIVFFAGVQLIILGTIGEYLGRLFLDHSKMPQSVVRYVSRRS